MQRCVFPRILIFLILCIWITFPGSSLSQARESHTGIYTLGEIVVTGQREGVESIGTVREISSEDIRERGARTLDEALELLPGLDIRTGGQGIPRVNIRGLRSRHILLLLNGIPLSSTFDGQFDPSIIPVENIAKIKVSYGTHSVLYGEGGLGGVINIVTKKGGKGFHGTASVEGAEGDQELVRFNLSGGEKYADFFLSGSKFERDGFLLSDHFDATAEENGDLRENSDKKRKSFFANAGFSPNDNLRIGIVMNYVEGECGRPPTTKNDGTDPFADKPKYERVDDFEGLSAQISTSYDPPGPLDVRAWLFINQQDEEKNRYDDNTYSSMDDASVKGTYHKEDETETRGATVQAGYDLKSGGLFSLGLSRDKKTFESEGEIREKKNKPFVPFENDSVLDTYSTALEYEVSPFENFGLVLGYSHHWLKKKSGKDDNQGSFLVGAHYDILEHTRIRGSVARKIRFPSIRQLYDEQSGNANLTTERSVNYELGVEQGLARDTSISVTGFIVDAEDFIEKDEATEIYENHDKYRFQGFELTAESRFIKNLKLRASYTFMDTEDRSTGTQIDELEHRPRHKFTFEANYDFCFGLSVHANVMRVADQVFYSRNAPVTKKNLNDYTLVNLKVEQALFNERLGFFLGMDNLFDEDYEESYGFPQPGRTLYAGMNLQF